MSIDVLYKLLYYFNMVSRFITTTIIVQSPPYEVVILLIKSPLYMEETVRVCFLLFLTTEL